MTKLTFVQRSIGQFVSQNSAAILTGVGVAGTVATAVLAGRAGIKASRILLEGEREIVIGEVRELAAAGNFEDDTKSIQAIIDREMTFAKKFKKTWPVWLPPLAMGTATVVAIVMSNRINAQRAAAMAAAYGLSQERFKEYRDKVEEKIGLKKATDVRAESAQEIVDKNPPNKETIILTTGDVLFRDMLTGRYFRSTVETVMRAENFINGEILDQQYASLTDFYDQIGLDGTTFTDEVGWNQMKTGQLEVKLDTGKTADGQPCMTMDFAKAPVTDYQQLY